jgi:hypothetical protein
VEHVLLVRTKGNAGEGATPYPRALVVDSAKVFIAFSRWVWTHQSMPVMLIATGLRKVHTGNGVQMGIEPLFTADRAESHVGKIATAPFGEESAGQ